MFDVVDYTPPVDAILDRIYRIDHDTQTWLDGLRETTSGIGDHAIAVLYRLHAGAAEIFGVSGSDDAKALMREVTEAGADGARNAPLMFRAPSTLMQSALMDTYPLPGRYADAYRRFGGSDCWALGGTSVCGVGVGMGSILRRRGRLTKRASRHWTSVATHVTAAARLRTSFHAPNEAVLAPDGKLLHAEGVAQTADSREALRLATKAIDRARTGIDDALIALESCRALVAGRWTLVDEHESDGRRFLVARVNEPTTPRDARLSEREQQVVALTLHGRATKQIAYELGIELVTVATHLRRALRKLGLPSRMQLITKGLPP